MSAEELTFDDVAAQVQYDAVAGRFFWLPRPAAMFERHRDFKIWNTKFAGAETLKSRTMLGYCQGLISGKRVKAHRIAWLLHHGRWPEFGIDHINGVKSDNRIVNLRDVPQAENNKNSSLPRTSTTGVIGVAWHKNHQSWQAYITIGGQRKNLGRHADFNDAVSARREAERRFGFHRNHGRVLQGAA